MSNLKSTRAIVLLLVSILLSPVAMAREINTLGCGEGYGPTEQNPPVYPRRAQARGIEGYVVMGFTIADDGSVNDIRVVEQEPKNTFVRSAMRAVESLQFPPCIINGEATEQASVSIKYDFQLQR